ncbi:hypothetical protein ACFLS9_08860 [Bacteroidota bacterium]
MNERKQFWIGLAVSILGLIVGISYLLTGIGEGASSRDLIIGIVCTTLATGWLIYIFIRKSTKN